MNTTALGQSSQAFGVNSTAVGVAASATGDKTTALGSNTKVTANNSAAVGSDSVAERGAQTYRVDILKEPQVSVGEVSVGSPGQERQITNVAAGSAPKDAVNMEQLTASNTRMRKGIASAAALAGLVPDPRSSDENQVAVSVANFNGENALAFGYIRRTSVGITVRAAMSYNGSKHVVTNLAASWGW